MYFCCTRSGLPGCWVLVVSDGFLLYFTGFYWVSDCFLEVWLSSTGKTLVYWVLLSFIELYRVLKVFFWVSLSVYWVLLGSNGFYWVLLGFYFVFTGFYWVLLSFTGFYWVLLGFTLFLLGFTGFYWVLLRFLGFYRVLLGFGESYGLGWPIFWSAWPSAETFGREIKVKAGAPRPPKKGSHWPVFFFFVGSGFFLQRPFLLGFQICYTRFGGGFLWNSLRFFIHYRNAHDWIEIDKYFG